MEQNRGRFNYIMFIMLLLGVVVIMSMFGRTEDNYTREQFISDVEAGRVESVAVNPNSEMPTGYLNVTLKSGTQRKFFVTDIVEAEALARSYGFDPSVKDVPRESWVMTTLVPLLIVLAVGGFLFMMVNAQNANSGNSKMMNFGKSRATLCLFDKPVTFAQVAGLKEEKEELEEIVEDRKSVV